MPDCEYCNTTFQNEEPYLEHLRDQHYKELGRIDRSRVDRLETDEGTNTWLSMAAVALTGLILLGGVFFLFTNGGATGGTSSSPTPHGLWSVHDHGSIDVKIDGKQLDFSQDKYQVQADYFHFENGNGEKWHVHGKGVTLQYAMNTLGINVTNSSITYDGTTYSDSNSGTTVTVTVNGEAVNPGTYVLKDGDRVRIIVETNN